MLPAPTEGNTPMHIEERLEALGFVLPEPMQVPQGLRMPFAWVRLRANRAYISGHIALNPDGSVAQPLGKVGAEVTAEEGYHSARLVALAHLATWQASNVSWETWIGSAPGCVSLPWSTQRLHKM